MKKNILAALTLGYILSSFISQPANAMYLGGNSDIDTTDISDNVLYSSSNETTPNYDLTNSSLTLKITPIDTDHNIKALSSYSLFLNDNNTHIGDIHTMLRKDLESMPSTMIYPPEQEVLAVYNKLAYIIKPNRNNELISFDDIKLQVSMDQILEQLNLHEFDPTDRRIVNNTLDITLPISINFESLAITSGLSESGDSVIDFIYIPISSREISSEFEDTRAFKLASISAANKTLIEHINPYQQDTEDYNEFNSSLEQIKSVVINEISLEPDQHIDNDASVLDNSNPKVISVNGNPITHKPIINNAGVVIVPIREIAEAMGFKVEWDEDRRQVTINKDRINSLLNIDQDAYNVARDYRQLGTAPEIINDITYVPINFINEILNASVEYTQTHILINTQEDSSYPYTYGESETQTDDIFILERLTEDYTDAGDINLQ